MTNESKLKITCLRNRDRSEGGEGVLVWRTNCHTALGAGWFQRDPSLRRKQKCFENHIATFFLASHFSHKEEEEMTVKAACCFCVQLCLGIHVGFNGIVSLQHK